MGGGQDLELGPEDLSAPAQLGQTERGSPVSSDCLCQLGVSTPQNTSLLRMEKTGVLHNPRLYSKGWTLTTCARPPVARKKECQDARTLSPGTGSLGYQEQPENREQTHTGKETTPAKAAMEASRRNS